jgi:hypothetical protein
MEKINTKKFNMFCDDNPTQDDTKVKKLSQTLLNDKSNDLEKLNKFIEKSDKKIDKMQRRLKNQWKQ